MEENRFNEKQIASTKVEAQKLVDLDFLGNQTIQGPYTTSESVMQYIENEPESASKNVRMYIEIRFHRNSCMTIGTTEMK